MQAAASKDLEAAEKGNMQKSPQKSPRLPMPPSKPTPESPSKPLGPHTEDPSKTKTENAQDNIQAVKNFLYENDAVPERPRSVLDSGAHVGLHSNLNSKQAQGSTQQAAALSESLKAVPGAAKPAAAGAQQKDAAVSIEAKEQSDLGGKREGAKEESDGAVTSPFQAASAKVREPTE